MSQGSGSIGDLEEVAFDLIALRYMLGGLSEQQMDMLRREIDVDVTIAMAALGSLGVVVVDESTDAAGLTDLGRAAIRRLRGMAEPGDPVLQVRITLRDVDDPPVWRQVLVPAAYPLSRVHRVIQAAMGWEDCHLHAFQIGKMSYGPDPDGELGYADDTKACLADVVRVRTRISYEYDFGDGWEHELVVEARAVAQAGQVYPAACTTPLASTWPPPTRQWRPSDLRRCASQILCERPVVHALTRNTHAVRTAGEEGCHKVPIVSGPSTASPAGTTLHRGRARVLARTRLDFWFDAVILAGYTVAYSYRFTGVAIHEWLGIGLGIALLLHLTLHWDWSSPRPDGSSARPVLTS